MTASEREARKRARKAAHHARYMRQWRAERGMRPGAKGPIPRKTCPDPSVYCRHLRHGETPDAGCKEAWAIYRRIGAEAYRADEERIRAELIAKHTPPGPP
jgi:hypothetical protein